MENSEVLLPLLGEKPYLDAVQFGTEEGEHQRFEAGNRDTRRGFQLSVYEVAEELGVPKTQRAVYEWLPLRCGDCKGWGYRTQACREKRESLRKRRVVNLGAKVGAGEREDKEVKFDLDPRSVPHGMGRGKLPVVGRWVKVRKGGGKVGA
ncbi:hypothetical protein Dimus_006126 [Dionaea muscipula]